jgi:hypothetical protein
MLEAVNRLNPERIRTFGGVSAHLLLQPVERCVDLKLKQRRAGAGAPGPDIAFIDEDTFDAPFYQLMGQKCATDAAANDQDIAAHVAFQGRVNTQQPIPHPPVR